MRAKTQIGELAVFGGAPAFAEALHVGRPNIGDRAALSRRIAEILDSRWLTNRGPFVQEFERRVAAFAGVPHCVAACNATVALEIAIRALGMRGEVIVPSFTFVATAHVLQWLEITPVFCDIEPQTHTLDPRQVEARITPRTTGILGVHVWGQACAVEALTALARRRGLRLLFDAAHAFGCTWRGRMMGNFGDAEVYSFHATKFINTFEGGAIVTHDDALAARLRLMQNFGFSGYDQVDCVGINGKMPEVSAAMGLTSLESLPRFVEHARRNYAVYRRGLEGVPGLRMLAYDEREQNNFQYVVLEVEEAAYGLSRDQLVRILHAENVLARRYFHPGCHRMEPYRSRAPEAGAALPVTERAAERVLVLPTGTAVGPEAAERICDLIRLVGREAGAVRSRLA
jgi:dTDP-4-amino-4,6-dideoxygalactose transaminase